MFFIGNMPWMFNTKLKIHILHHPPRNECWQDLHLVIGHGLQQVGQDNHQAATLQCEGPYELLHHTVLPLEHNHQLVWGAGLVQISMLPTRHNDLPHLLVPHAEDVGDPPPSPPGDIPCWWVCPAPTIAVIVKNLTEHHSCWLGIGKPCLHPQPGLAGYVLDHVSHWHQPRKRGTWGQGSGQWPEKCSPECAGWTELCQVRWGPGRGPSPQLISEMKGKFKCVTTCFCSRTQITTIMKLHPSLPIKDRLMETLK